MITNELRIRLILIMFLSLILIFSNLGCKTLSKQNRPPQKAKIIRIDKFKCDNENLSEAVRNMFCEFLANNTNADYIMEGDADFVIDGVVIISYGVSTKDDHGGMIVSHSPIPVAWSKSSSEFEGQYIEGVSVSLKNNSKYILSASFFQAPIKGKIRTTQNVVEVCAQRMCSRLIQEGYVYRKD